MTLILACIRRSGEAPRMAGASQAHHCLPALALPGACPQARKFPLMAAGIRSIRAS